MKSVKPSRIRSYSSATGSLTFSTRSTPPSVPHASSAVETTFAPAPAYSSSLTWEPRPAPVSIKTS